MKILIINNQLRGFFGTKRELVKSLIDAGYEVYISSPDSCEVPKELESCIYVGNTINRFGTNPVKELSSVKALRRQVKEIQPDVILTYTIKPNLYTLLAVGRKVPVLPNVTGLSAFLFRKGLVPRLISKMQTHLFKKAYCVFCQNSSTFDSFSKLGLDNLVLLPGSGVNLEEAMLQSYPVYDGKIECTFVARIQRDKGFYEFIDAAKRLPDFNFTVIGASEDQEIVKAFKSTENISYLGPLPHDKTLEKIACSHVLILPSYHEGMANVLLEAQALGRPVLTTDVPGCIDAMVDGETGFTFKAKSADAIVDACVKFSQFDASTWKNMGLKGRRFVEVNFDRKKVIDIYNKKIVEAFEKNDNL